MKKILCKIFGHFYGKTEWKVVIEGKGFKTSNYKDTCKLCGHIDAGGVTEFGNINYIKR